MTIVVQKYGTSNDLLWTAVEELFFFLLFLYSVVPILGRSVGASNWHSLHVLTVEIFSLICVFGHTMGDWPDCFFDFILLLSLYV